MLDFGTEVSDAGLGVNGKQRAIDHSSYREEKSDKHEFFGKFADLLSVSRMTETSVQKSPTRSQVGAQVEISWSSDVALPFSDDFVI